MTAQEECDLRSIAKTKTSLPGSTTDDSDSESDEPENDDQPLADNPASKSKKSEYEQERDRNIARNKEILRQLEVKFAAKNPDADIQPRSKHKPQKKGKGKGARKPRDTGEGTSKRAFG